MQFKHPEFLYALFAVLIPIIIHLFQLRKFKKVEFTNVQLLKTVKLQTRKSSQIKKWLTLLARMLAITCVILAFAQPFQASLYGPNQSEETVIYLDNSFSMQAKGSGSKSSLLKQGVQDLLTYLPGNKRLTLFTNNKVFRNVKLSDIRDELLTLSFTADQIPYKSVFQKGKSFFSNDHSAIKQFVLISDFQDNTPLPQPKDSDKLKTSIVQLKPESNSNKSIDSVFLSRDKNRELFLNTVISTTDNKKSDVSVAVYNEEKLIGKTTVSLNDKKQVITQFKINEGQLIKGKVKIEDNALSFDNTFYFTLNPTEKVKVVVINDNNSNFLKRIYTNDEFELKLETLNRFDYNLIDTSNLLILAELKEIPVPLINAIQNFTTNGGSFCLIPAFNADLPSYNQLLSVITNTSFEEQVPNEQKITKINFDHPLYQGVFDKRVTNFQYPKVNFYFKTTALNTALFFAGNQPFLFTDRNSFIFTSALSKEYSNFQNSPLIVPTFFNIAKQSLSMGEIYFTIGKTNSFDLPISIKGDETIKLVSKEDQIIPLQQSFSNKVKITTTENPEKSGIYSLKLKNQDLKYVAYNYNATESNLQFYRSEDFGIAIFNNISTAFGSLKQAFEVRDLWKWFVIFALIFLSIEIAILKFLP